MARILRNRNTANGMGGAGRRTARPDPDFRATRTRVGIGAVLHTGRQLDVRETVPLPDFGSLQFPRPVEVDVAVRRVGGGLELRGSVDGIVRGECARCLEPVDLPLHVELDERFAPLSENDDPLGESNVLAGDELDLQDLVRQLIDSALPIVLLCNANCPGLCPDCGHIRDGTCRCTHPE